MEENLENSQQKKGLTWGEKVQELQSIPDRIRNICILAHVDHGKTTLSDSLISSNQIISQKLAGTLRYLDSREDEQQRMITMKAASISLIYGHQTPVKNKQKSTGDQQKQAQQPQYEEKQYLINLMDSPGHVDFSSEVSSALRLSDGAIVLVDVIEGVSPQTFTVLKQAWEERVKVCLVLNKIDRLILDKDLSGIEIFHHLQQIIEQVNSIIAELISKDYYEESFKVYTQQQVEGQNQEQMNFDNYDEELEKIESECFFHPEKGNVAFSSAQDCWAFNLTGFSQKIASKLGMNARILQKFLWGNYYYQASQKKILKQPPTSSSLPMFVQFVIEPLIKEYKKFITPDMLSSSAQYKEGKTKIKNLLSKSMPVEKGIISMIISHLPAPIVAQKNRMGIICPSLYEQREDSEFIELKQTVEQCSQNDSNHAVSYITKMQPYSGRLYNIITRDDVSSVAQQDQSQRLVAFARVFSGTLKEGQKVYVLGPKHGINGQEDIQEATIDHLFLLMGSNLQKIQKAPAGCIVGIGGLEDKVVKIATISTSKKCPNFAKTKSISLGIVKVAIEAAILSQMETLKQGLQRLDRADPSVQFHINSQGEYILSTCGEVHLERCIRDLKDEYAKDIQIEISEPIVTFKETIVNQKLSDKKKKKQKAEYEEIGSSSDSEEEEVKAEEEKTLEDFIKEYEKLNQEVLKEREFLRKEMQPDMYIEKILQVKHYKGNMNYFKALGLELNCATDNTANQKCSIKIRAVGLNFEVTKWLENHTKSINVVQHLIEGYYDGNPKEQDIEAAIKFAKDFKQQLEEHSTNKRLIRLIFEKTACFGPKRKGPNILINKYFKKEDSFFQRLFKVCNIEEQKEEMNQQQQKRQDRRDKEEEEKQQQLSEVLNSQHVSFKDLNSACISGFDISTYSGPLCEESMLGAIFIVENIQNIKQNENESQYQQEQTQDHNEEYKSDTYGPFTGQVISVMKDLCKRAFLNADPRIVEGMYLCTLQATPETYGKIYGVINKCRGKVVKEEIQDGTNNFLLEALIPVIESFVFNDEIRKKSFGIAYPQLVFHGFVINENDPFYVPQTEEELEEHGEGDILPPNPAKIIIEKVRTRKGLPIDKKIVVSAEQQRNLSKNK